MLSARYVAQGDEIHPDGKLLSYPFAPMRSIAVTGQERSAFSEGIRTPILAWMRPSRSGGWKRAASSCNKGSPNSGAKADRRALTRRR